MSSGVHLKDLTQPAHQVERTVSSAAQTSLNTYPARMKVHAAARAASSRRAGCPWRMVMVMTANESTNCETMVEALFRSQRCAPPVSQPRSETGERRRVEPAGQAPIDATTDQRPGAGPERTVVHRCLQEETRRRIDRQFGGRTPPSQRMKATQILSPKPTHTTLDARLRP